MEERAEREREEERSGDERGHRSSLEERRKNARGLMLPRRSRQAKQTLFAILPGPVRTYRVFSAAFPRQLSLPLRSFPHLCTPGRLPPSSSPPS